MEFYNDPFTNQHTEELFVKILDYICSWVEWVESISSSKETSE